VEVTVKDGEWVGSIAASYGHLAWDVSVWLHDRNKSLREKRTDPHLLSPGDVLFIPARGDKEIGCTSESKHRFQLRRTFDHLRLRLLDQAGRPRAEAQYALTIEFSDGSEHFAQRGTASDAEGIIEEQIPSSATRAVLKLEPGGEEIELRLGHLEPLDPSNEAAQRKAVQQRLAALGFFHGEVNGSASPGFTSALQAFQQFCRDRIAEGGTAPDAGEPDGQLTASVGTAIKNYYGC
jgi:hypothetical protein